MIVKLALYNNENEIGEKFITYDNTIQCITVYCEVIPSKMFNGKIVIKDKLKVNTKIKMLHLELGQKTSEIDETLNIYTDNEVYICNDSGQTIEKFRKL